MIDVLLKICGDMVKTHTESQKKIDKYNARLDLLITLYRLNLATDQAVKFEKLNVLMAHHLEKANP